MARARAMDTRCFWPPESWAGYWSAWSARPTRSSSAMARSSAARRLMPLTLTRATDTLRRALRWSKRLKSWKIMPTCWRKAYSSRLEQKRSSLPSSQTRPESGGMRKLMHCKSVLLPPAGRADEHLDPALLHLQGGVAQHVVGAEGLVQVLDLENGAVGHQMAPSWE